MVPGQMNANSQQSEFLSWKIVPARLTATQTAWFLGFKPEEITLLIAAGLLKPLGHPPRNGTKFFATETLELLRRDEKWLARASDAICAYWRESNARKGIHGHAADAENSATRLFGRSLQGNAPLNEAMATG
jgi:hypothetical protein